MSENKNTWVSTAADKLLLLLLLLLLLPAFSQFFLCCTAYFHKSTKPSHFHIPALSFSLTSPPLPLPLTVCLLFMFAVDLQLQILLRLRSFVCYVFFPCLPDKGSDTVCMRVRPCVSVCACECVVWVHGAQHWVNTLAAARAVYVVDVNTIASWQILLETFEFSQFGLASRLLFNNWMALQLVAFSWL